MQSGRSLLPQPQNQVTEQLILRKIRQLRGDQDAGALLAMLTDGIYYVTVVSDHQPKLINIDSLFLTNAVIL